MASTTTDERQSKRSQEQQQKNGSQRRLYNVMTSIKKFEHEVPPARGRSAVVLGVDLIRPLTDGQARRETRSVCSCAGLPHAISGAQLLLDVLEFLDVLLEVAARKLGEVDVLAVKSGWNNT